MNGLPDLRALPDSPVPDGRTVLIGRDARGAERPGRPRPTGRSLGPGCLRLHRDDEWRRVGAEQLTRRRVGVEIDARKVRAIAPLACKTDKADACVLADLARRDLPV